MNNHYDLLEVPPTATAADIKKAYRAQLIRFHPDRNPGDPQAAEMTRLLIEAYAILSDPATRHHYDATLREQSFQTWLHSLVQQQILQRVTINGVPHHCLAGPVQVDFPPRFVQQLMRNYSASVETGGLLLFAPTRQTAGVRLELREIVPLRNCSRTPRTRYEYDPMELDAGVRKALAAGRLPCIFHTHPTAGQNLVWEAIHYHRQLETSILDRLANLFSLYPQSFRLRLPEFLVIGNGQRVSNLFIGAYGGLIAPMAFAARKRKLEQTFREQTLTQLQNWLQSPTGQTWAPLLGLTGLLALVQQPQKLLQLVSRTALLIPPLLYAGTPVTEQFALTHGEAVTIHLPVLSTTRASADEGILQEYHRRRRRASVRRR